MKQSLDPQLVIGKAFLAAWGELMTRGWRERIAPLESNIKLVMHIFRSAGIPTEGCITVDDIDTVNEVVDAQAPDVRDVIHYYFRRDGIFRDTRTYSQVADRVGIKDWNKVQAYISTVALVVYGRLLPKITEARLSQVVRRKPPRPKRSAGFEIDGRELFGKTLTLRKN